jgi:phosphomannomutase
MTAPIKFGTDGWRAIIADDFTFANVRRLAGAIAAYTLKHEDARQGLLVGYDTRFASRRAAELVAETLAAAGIAVRLASDYTPTPAVSYGVVHFKAAGAVVVTSSHNPWNWNGMKFKASYGGSATPAIMQAIEQELAAGSAPQNSKAGITETDLKAPYVEALCKFAQPERLAEAKFKFAIDSMHGAGRGVLSGIFRRYGVEHLEIRGEVNPLFPGINPEPIEPHVALLQHAVVREECHAGFAVDGDADRIGAVDENGRFVDAHKIFSILLAWLLERRDWPGDVVRAFNTTRMLDRIAARHGRRLHECRIGFKYICDIMAEREVLIGGEESGGVGYSRHLPERDGILNSLLLALVMAEEGKTMGELVERLQRDFGAHHYGRRDLHIADEVKQAAIARAAGAGEMGSYRVLRREDLDGIKLFLDAETPHHGAEAWVLLRASGTEPLLRIYAEAASPELVRDVLQQAEAFVMEKRLVVPST